MEPDDYQWLQSVEIWQNNQLTDVMTRELEYKADDFDMGQDDEVDVPTGLRKRMKGSEIVSNVDEFMRAESEKWAATQIKSEMVSPFNTPVREIPDLQVRDPERLITPPCPLHTPIGVKHSVV